MKKLLAIMLSVLVLPTLLSCELETPIDSADQNDSASNYNDSPSNNNNADTDISDVPPPVTSERKEKKHYVITFAAQIIKNNSVGNSWSSGVKFNGNTVAYGETIEADPPAVLSLVAYAVEEDKANSDHGNATVEFSDIAIGEKETKTVTVTVTENEGRYKGNTAEWEFNITIERIK